MIIFLHGKDSYRIKESIDKILDGYLKKNTSGVNVSKFDFAESSSGDLIRNLEETIKTMPFFEEKKIIVINDIFTTPHSGKLIELISRWQLTKSKEIIAIVKESLNETELKKKDKKLFEVLNSNAEINKEIAPLESAKLITWIKSEFKNRNIEANPDAIKKLIESVYSNDGHDLGSASWRMIQEINKLANYSTDGKITAADVRTMITVETEQQIFPILDSLGDRNNVRAFTLLYQNISNGMDPWYIFSMMAYQFRNLLTLKSLLKEGLPFPEIVKKSGLNPYVARKTFDQAKHFELDELKRRFSHLAEIEINTKNGLADITDEIYSLVF